MVRPERRRYCYQGLSEGRRLLAEHEGPWSFPPDPPPAAQARPRPRLRLTAGLWVWLGLVGAAIALVAVLNSVIPGQLGSMDSAEVIRLIGFLALVSSGLLFARRMPLRTTVRNIAIWALVVSALLLGYSFRGEAARAVERVRGELLPGYGVTSGPHTLTLTASEDGGFYAMGTVNGATVRFAIDTGAGGIVLSPDDARRMGLDLDALTFSAASETANGVGYWAPYTASSLTVGPIKFANVPVQINKAPMSASLLGMSFLKRLDSFEVRGDQITLKWR